MHRGGVFFVCPPRPSPDDLGFVVEPVQEHREGVVPDRLLQLLLRTRGPVKIVAVGEASAAVGVAHRNEDAQPVHAPTLMAGNVAYPPVAPGQGS